MHCCKLYNFGFRIWWFFQDLLAFFHVASNTFSPLSGVGGIAVNCDQSQNKNDNSTDNNSYHNFIDQSIDQDKQCFKKEEKMRKLVGQRNISRHSLVFGEMRPFRESSKMKVERNTLVSVRHSFFLPQKMLRGPYFYSLDRHETLPVEWYKQMNNCVRTHLAL